MALILADRVRETTNTTGTGAVTLAGAITGYQAFSAVMADTDTCYYTIAGQNTSEWEVGLGTYASGGNTLTRTTVYASSNSGSAVSFSSGDKDVFITYPAERAAYASNSPTTSGYVLTANGTGTAPSWQAGASVSSATPSSEGIVYGKTTNASPYVATLGYAAGNVNTAIDGTFIGYQAGLVNSTGIDNSFVGFSSGKANTTAERNTALGSYSLAANISTSNNTAIGYAALSTNIGSRNTAVGSSSLQQLNNAGAGDNVAVGYQAGYSATTSRENVYLGAYSGYSVANGLYNVLVGFEAGYTQTSAGNNTFVGYQSGKFNSANNGTLIGYQSGYSITSGANNTIVGYLAGRDIQTGGNNTCIGYRAGRTGTNNLTTGANNILIGADAQASSSTVSNEATWGNSSITSNRFWGDLKPGDSSAGTAGQVLTSQGAGVSPTWTTVGGGGSLTGITSAASPYTTALGTGAAPSTTGLNAVAIGYNALHLGTLYDDVVAVGANTCSGGTGNERTVAVGSNAFKSGTYVYSCVAVGPDAGYSATSTESCTFVGDSAGYSNNSSIGRNTFLGYWAGYGHTTGSNCTVIGYLAEASTATVSNQITLGNSSISTLRCQVTSITALSDARDKKDVAPIKAGLEFVNKLKPVEFVWNMRDGGKIDVPDTGFIAQELKATQEETGVIIPGLVYEENPEKLEAAYGKLLPVMVQAIKDLSQEVNLLRAELNQLKGV